MGAWMGGPHGGRAVVLAVGGFFGCSLAGGGAALWWARQRHARAIPAVVSLSATNLLQPPSALIPATCFDRGGCQLKLTDGCRLRHGRLDLKSEYKWTDVNALLGVAAATAAAAQAGFLISVAADGQPHARVVDPLCGPGMKRVRPCTAPAGASANRRLHSTQTACGVSPTRRVRLRRSGSRR